MVFDSLETNGGCGQIRQDGQEGDGNNGVNACHSQVTNTTFLNQTEIPHRQWL